MSALDQAFDSPERKRQHVRRLFATIADRYDLITRLLSYGLDQRWKRRLVRLAGVIPGERALDLASGTGDVALAVAEAGATAVGLDVTHHMLRLARGKARARPRGRATWVTGDMGALPCRDGTFTLVTASYGLRNVPDLDAAIGEIARVLAPGGRFVSLDFNRPEQPVVRAVYLAYLGMVGGALGWLLHGEPDTYRYIPASIRRYPGAHGVADRLRRQGFSGVDVVPLLWGLLTIHVARAPASEL